MLLPALFTCRFVLCSRRDRVTNKPAHDIGVILDNVSRWDVHAPSRTITFCFRGHARLPHRSNQTAWLYIAGFQSYESAPHNTQGMSVARCRRVVCPTNGIPTVSHFVARMHVSAHFLLLALSVFHCVGGSA